MKKIFLTLILLTTQAIATTDIPFDPARGLVEVEVLINGHIKGRFGIDTGADRLYIDRFFGLKHGLEIKKSSGERDIIGIAGSSKAESVMLRSIEFGSEILVNQRATAIDLAKLVADSSADIPDGLLGFEVLKNFYVTVDYPKHKLQLSENLPRIIYGNSYKSESFDLYRHMIIVDVLFNDSVRAPMILDYCASYTVISKSLAARLKLKPTGSGYALADKIELGGMFSSDRVTVVITSLENYRRRSPGAKFEGLLGGSFLRDHTITIDYKKKQIYLHEKN